MCLGRAVLIRVSFKFSFIDFNKSMVLFHFLQNSETEQIFLYSLTRVKSLTVQILELIQMKRFLGGKLKQELKLSKCFRMQLLFSHSLWLPLFVKTLNLARNKFSAPQVTGSNCLLEVKTFVLAVFQKVSILVIGFL